MINKQIKKQCSIAIIGQPNVGKSTLLNQIFHKKIAIVSYKPQTTRNSIKAIYENEKMKILFLDTPGFHESKTKLDTFLNSQIKISLKKANFILFLIDSRYGMQEKDNKLLEFVKSYGIKKIIYIFTKFDLNKQIDIGYFKKTFFSNNVIAINSFEQKDIDKLLSLIYQLIDKNDFISDESNIEDDDFLIKEIIREQALFNLKYEVPHSLAVEITHKEFNHENNLFTINADLIVEKNSQKTIVIGKNGSMIKLIGTKSRIELLKVFDCKIMLKLFVKVKTNWRNDENILSSLGYFKK